MADLLERLRQRLDEICGVVPGTWALRGVPLGLFWLGLFVLAYLFGGSNAKFVYVDF